MNILIVTQYFWPESFRINDLAVGLQQLGHEVTVLTGMPNYPGGSRFSGYRWFNPAREDFNGIEVVRVPLITRGRSKGLRLVANYLSFALSASLLGPLRCGGGFDIVLIYEPSPITVGIPGLLMAAIKRAPAMLWVQDLWPDTLEAMGIARGNPAARCATWLSDFIHRRCDRVMVQSKGFISRLTTRGVTSSRIIYLPNWAEAFYQPLAPQENIPDPMAGTEGFRVLFAGNIGNAQSFETILDAASRLRDLPDLRLIILGNGHMREWLIAEIAKRGLKQHIRLLGQHPPETMPVYFAHADALLVTLRANPVFSLTIPSKIQSYLACAKPIIACIDGEGAEVIRESGAGITCPAEDSAMLADAVRRLYRMSSQERAAYGTRGRSYFEKNFERGLLLDQLDRWMHDLKNEHNAYSHTGR